MVRLITHNIVTRAVRGPASTTNNFPLRLQDVKVELREAEFHSEFIRGFFPRIEWKALAEAAKQVCIGHAVPHRCIETEGGE